jgi:DNA-binding IclR family transcriptional regulator
MSSLENGLRILALLRDERPILRVGEVCRELNIPKASVSRLLRTLAEANMLERDERDGSYYVGERSLDLARLFLAQHNLLDLVRSAVEVLVEEFGFTGHAGIVSGPNRVLLLAKQGWYPLQHTGAIAERKPAFESIIGRAILARMSDSQILAQLGYETTEQILQNLSGAEILAEVQRVRQDRVAYSSSLVTPGISSAGAAIADPGRNEVLGFCLSYPSAAADRAVEQRIRDAVYFHASQIGRKLRDPVWLVDDPAIAAISKTTPSTLGALVQETRR